MASLQARLEVATSTYQNLQVDLSNAIEARQKLETQLNENELVMKEFALLTPGNTVYKAVGPVLVKQDQDEAKSNVKKRLEFIRGEIKRVEAQLKDLNEKNEKVKMEIVEIQTAHQAQQKQLSEAPPAIPAS